VKRSDRALSEGLRAGGTADFTSRQNEWDRTIRFLA
jgi:hypothetical protein